MRTFFQFINKFPLFLPPLFFKEFFPHFLKRITQRIFPHFLKRIFYPTFFFRTAPFFTKIFPTLFKKKFLPPLFFYIPPLSLPPLRIFPPLFEKELPKEFSPHFLKRIFYPTFFSEPHLFALKFFPHILKRNFYPHFFFNTRTFLR